VHDGNIFITFFTFYDFFIGKNMFSAKKTFKIFGVKQIIPLIYFMHAESKNQDGNRFKISLQKSIERKFILQKSLVLQCCRLQDRLKKNSNFKNFQFFRLVPPWHLEVN
jgi:hypothetical protein